MSLQKQLDNLKKVIPPSGSGGESGPVGDRLAKLQQDAGGLANTTENMLKALEGNTAKPQHHMSSKRMFIFSMLFTLHVHLRSSGRQ